MALQQLDQSMKLKTTQGWYLKSNDLPEDLDNISQDYLDVYLVPFDFNEPIVRNTEIAYFENPTIETAFKDALDSFINSSYTNTWESNGKEFAKIKINDTKYIDPDTGNPTYDADVNVLDKNVSLIQALFGQEAQGGNEMVNLIVSGQLSDGMLQIVETIEASGASYFSIPFGVDKFTAEGDLSRSYSAASDLSDLVFEAGYHISFTGDIMFLQ